MPSSTFLNLSEQKRTRIINNCYEEFTKYNYHDASISRIVKDIGIAKGSIYKYFKNKKELYFYLIEQASNRKLSYLNHHFQPKSDDFFDVIWELMKNGAQFDLTHAMYSNFIARVSMPNNDPFDHTTINMMIERSYEFIYNYVKKAQDGGEINDVLDAELITFVINTLMTHAGNYIAKKYHLSNNNLLPEMQRKLLNKELYMEDILHDLKKIVLLLSSGIDSI